MADAVLLVRSGSIDWARLADEAVAVGRPASVEAALRLLATEFATEVPSATFDRLRAPRRRWRAMLEALTMRPPTRAVVIAKALVEDYAMVAIGRGFWRGLVGYPGYARARSYRGVGWTARRVLRIAARGAEND